MEDAKKRIEALEEYVRNNPNSSTLEREQLKELKDQQSKEDSKPAEVLY